ncbi:chaperonin 10-like protein [Fusarium oxysporum f. sp. albedinis]|nr:chaperonin 10-like protein [Fusarium oxysporum f. sp. albedinis]
MRALVLNTSDKSITVQDVPKPKPGPKEILVRVRAVALNHVDYMNALKPLAAQEKRVLGSDFAGEVAEAGSDLVDLHDPRVKIGERVSGFLQGANSVNDRPGAFSEYLVVDYDLCWNIPRSVSFEEAATVSLAGMTAAQAVFSRLHLPSPFSGTKGFNDLDLAENEPVNVFIYGASSSVGLYAAQLVRLSEKTSSKKINLIGAASPPQHALLYKAPYSYDTLVDYRDSAWPGMVRKAAGGVGVHYAIDAISKGSTVEQTDSVIQDGGKLAIFRAPAAGGFDITKLKRKPIFGAVWEALGVDVVYHGGVVIPSTTDSREFAAAFFNFLSSGAASNEAKLQPNPVRVLPGGLDKISSEGFGLLSGSPQPDQGQTREVLKPVSGEKIVYLIG